jgi:prepilin-type N-terminal cleavage/methylation domain-containing protein
MDVRTGTRGYSLVELLVVVGITSVIGAIAVPMTANTMRNFKIVGDARSLSSAVSLAKLRAASQFTQSRVFIDRDAGTFRVESWQKTGVIGWATDQTATRLSNTVTFGFGAVGAPPAATQAAIGQAAECVDLAGTAIGNTSCILFNSRGIPVAAAGAPPNVGAPTGNGAIYVTDGSVVFGLTVSATGLSRLWRTGATSSTPTWVQQ